MRGNHKGGGSDPPPQLVEELSFIRRKRLSAMRGSTRGQRPPRVGSNVRNGLRRSPLPAKREIFKMLHILKIGTLAGCRKSPGGLFRQPEAADQSAAFAYMDCPRQCRSWSVRRRKTASARNSRLAALACWTSSKEQAPCTALKMAEMPLS